MIRKAVEHDLLRVIELSEEFYSHTHFAKLAPPNGVSIGALALMLMEQGSLFVAEVEGIVEGILGFICTPFMFNPALTGAHEVVLYVSPEHRKGLGIKLMLYAEQEFKRVGINFIQMADLPENTSGAGAMYQRLGYVTSDYSYMKVI